MAVLPLTLVVYTTMASGLWLMTTLKSTDIRAVGVFVIPFVLVVVRLLVRSIVAGDAHNEMKEKFGAIHREKIGRWEVSLSAFSVLLTRALERYKAMLESHVAPVENRK
jgi:hypothetical protein